MDFQVTAQDTRTCRLCSRVKPVEDFSRCGKYRASYCKPCQSVFASDWRIANREAVRAKRNMVKRTPAKQWEMHLRLRYGISVEQYDEMHSAQNGVCKICSKPESQNGKKRLSVDHCHSTNRVRGLLCDKCNNMLGRSNDSVELLYRAAKYLLETWTAK